MGCSSSKAVYAVSPAATEDKGSSCDFLQRYHLGEPLGAGAFAQVYTATDGQSGAQVAMKVMKSSQKCPRRASTGAVDLMLSDALRGKEANFKGLAQEEEAIWKKIGKHEHCLELLDSFQGPKLYFLAMEKCECTLMEKLESFKELEERVLSDFIRQLLLGCSHLHDQRIVHRDLKPDNVLVDTQGKLKLCDFGLAAQMPQDTLLEGMFGTPPFMSPEMVKKLGHDELTDMWSLGVMMYLLLFSCFPYVPKVKNAAAMKEIIKVGQPRPKYEPKDRLRRHISSTAKDFVRGLLVRAPAKRFTAKKALDDAFIKRDPDADRHDSTDWPEEQEQEPQQEAQQDQQQVGRPVRSRARKCTVTSEQLKAARAEAKGFNDHADATVQRDISDLLTELKPGLRRAFSFSLETDEEKEKFVAECANATVVKTACGISRRPTRSITHAGEVSVPLSVLDDLKNQVPDDDISTDSPCSDSGNDKLRALACA